MQIAICEDFPEDTRQLREVLNRYLEANSLVAEIDCFTDGEEFLAAFTPGKYQIIFMDIYMKKDGISGMDTAAKVNSTDPDAAIILVTTSEEHGIAGYSFAVYYIVKPISDEKLAAGMKKCRAQIERFAKTIEVIADRQPLQIRLRDIYCVESRQRTCIFTFAAGEIRTNMALDTLVERLGGFPFLRCHRSFIVNLIHVTDMLERDFVLQKGQKVPISKAYYAASQKAFKEYIRNMIQGKTV